MNCDCARPEENLSTKEETFPPAPPPPPHPPPQTWVFIIITETRELLVGIGQNLPPQRLLSIISIISLYTIKKRYL